MLLQRELIQRDSDSSIRFLLRREPAFDFCWHHHEECELTWISSGQGMRVVGEEIQPFDSGDLLLLGPGLPHTWWSAGTGQAKTSAATRVTTTPQEAYCVHFSMDLIRKLIESRPEGSRPIELLEESRVGLHFEGEVVAAVGHCLQRMERSSGLGRLGLLLESIDLLTRSTSKTRVCSAPWSGNERTSHRIDAACQYVLSRLDEPISQPEVAAAVGMSPAPFARFFRRHTGRTLTSYIQHSRVARACALLRDTDMPVVSIAFAAGFGNLSNFNRVFKRLRKRTPREYRQFFVDASGKPPI